MVSLQISCLQLHLRLLSYLQENREKQKTNKTLFTQIKAKYNCPSNTQNMLFEAGESKRIETMKMLVNLWLVIQKLICEVIDIENNTWSHGDMEFILECSHRYRTSERSERVRYTRR